MEKDSFTAKSTSPNTSFGWSGAAQRSLYGNASLPVSLLPPRRSSRRGSWRTHSHWTATLQQPTATLHQPTATLHQPTAALHQLTARCNSRQHVAPADSNVAPADSNVAPADSNVAPTDSNVAPADSRVASADGSVAPANSSTTDGVDGVSVHHEDNPVRDKLPQASEAATEWVWRHARVPRKFMNWLLGPDEIQLDNLGARYHVRTTLDPKRRMVHIGGSWDNVLEAYAAVKTLVTAWRSWEATQ